MWIANPIYDVVFKFLMEDNKIAKLLISKIINEEVIELIPKPQEKTIRIKDKPSFTVYHLDYSAVIKTAIGKKNVIIEIQKAKFLTDIMRFRQYLGSQYRNKSNQYIENGKSIPLPIISIYFLGYSLDNLPSPVLKVRRLYTDVTTHEEYNIKDEFIESLTHDAYIIQINRLKGKRRNDLEVLLSVFDQDNRLENFHILNVKEEDFPEEYRPIIRRLQKAFETPEIEDTMNIEDEIIEELAGKERLIAEKIKIIEEKDKTLEESKKELEESKKELEDKDKVLEEKDKVLEENKKLIENLLKQLESLKQ